MTLIRRPAPREDLAPVQQLRFQTVPGRRIAVCGLHGGAGTSSTAAALATQAARASGPGRVLLAETDPVGGGLADLLGRASPLALSDLAQLAVRGQAPTAAPFAELPDGLRLLAARAAPRPAPPLAAAATVLEQAGAAHPLTVTDCGTLREPHALAGLTGADTILWTVAADRLDLPWLRRRLAGPLTRPARTARWILAVTPTGPLTVTVRELQRAAGPLVQAVVLLAHAPGGAHAPALAAGLAAALEP